MMCVPHLVQFMIPTLAAALRKLVRLWGDRGCIASRYALRLGGDQVGYFRRALGVGLVNELL